MNTTPRFPLHRRKGSVLLVTVLLATGVALALGSFVALTVQSLKLSNRSFYSNSALNLAEAGLEEAVYALNRNNWNGWTTHSSGSANKTRTTSSINVGQGASGSFTVVVYGAAGTPQPRVVAEGRIVPSTGAPITKQLEVRLRRRSLWATGLVARDRVIFSGGNAEVDSYNSSDPNFSTAGLYVASKKRDRGSVGSLSVTTDAVSISNSDIWGFVATGGAQPQAGPNGTIRGADTPSGVKLDGNRITTDFSATLEIVTAPTTFDQVLGNVSGNATLGSLGSSTKILAANVSNTNGKTVLIEGNVTMVVTSAVDIKGSLVVAPNSSLTLYVAGDFEAGGNGAVNMSGIPANLIIYGTNPTTGGQTIKLHGNGILHAAVYAPNANLELKGGGSSGEMSGSAVAYEVKITGNYQFHYDEALEDLGGGNPFAVTRWRELHAAAERLSL